MKFLRKALLLIIPLILIDAFFIEPNWLAQRYYEISVPHLRQPIRILHLSDFHLHGPTGYRENWVSHRLRENAPDLICITGDVFETADGMNAAMDFIQQLARYAPVYVVLGNWEHWAHVDVHGYGVRLQQAGIHFLRNSSMSSTFHGQELTIAGVDDPSTYRADLFKALHDTKPDAPILLLSHAPVIFPEASKRVSVVLAGHTHGGQVVIPLWGPAWMPQGTWPYVYGEYRSGSATMVITSGVGLSNLAARFNCRPEIAWITLKG